MTWEWITLIVAFMAFIVAESYVSVLRARTEVAARTLGLPAAQEADIHEFAPRNGDS